MMTLNDFARSCEALAERGFTVEKAEYCDEAFGSWSIQFSLEDVPPHLLTWDGRDGWLILQCQRPENERTIRVTPEELRRMSYEDGATTHAQREADAWQDKWIGRDEADQSLDHALEQLGGT
jgi:hypothetical protein